MKRGYLCVIALVAAAALASCSISSAPAERQPAQDAASGASLAEFMSGEVKSMLENRETDPPVAVSRGYYGEGGGFQSPLYGPQIVDAALDALEKMTVLDETDERSSDDDSAFEFIFEDGSTVSVSFNSGNLTLGNKAYRVSDAGGLFSLSFPAVGRDTYIDSNGPDAALSALLSKSGDDAPVKAELTSSGGETRTVTDRAEIESLLNEFYSIELYTCDEDGPALGADGVSDRPARSVVFIAADGARCGAEFTGRNYVYSFPEPVGTCYYWMGDSADSLLELIDARAST